MKPEKQKNNNNNKHKIKKLLRLTSRDAAAPQNHQVKPAFQPSYTSSEVNTMPCEIGFPVTLTSDAFLNQKPNKQTRLE